MTSCDVLLRDLVVFLNVFLSPRPHKSSTSQVSNEINVDLSFPSFKSLWKQQHMSSGLSRVQSNHQLQSRKRRMSIVETRQSLNECVLQLLNIPCFDRMDADEDYESIYDASSCNFNCQWLLSQSPALHQDCDNNSHSSHRVDRLCLSSELIQCIWNVGVVYLLYCVWSTQMTVNARDVIKVTLDQFVELKLSVDRIITVFTAVRELRETHTKRSSHPSQSANDDRIDSIRLANVSDDVQFIYNYLVSTSVFAIEISPYSALPAYLSRSHTLSAREQSLQSIRNPEEDNESTGCGNTLYEYMIRVSSSLVLPSREELTEDWTRVEVRYESMRLTDMLYSLRGISLDSRCDSVVSRSSNIAVHNGMSLSRHYSFNAFIHKNLPALVQGTVMLSRHLAQVKTSLNSFKHVWDVLSGLEKSFRYCVTESPTDFTVGTLSSNSSHMKYSASSHTNADITSNSTNERVKDESSCLQDSAFCDILAKAKCSSVSLSKNVNDVDIKLVMEALLPSRLLLHRSRSSSSGDQQEEHSKRPEGSSLIKVDEQRLAVLELLESQLQQISSEFSVDDSSPSGDDDGDVVDDIIVDDVNLSKEQAFSSPLVRNQALYDTSALDELELQLHDFRAASSLTPATGLSHKKKRKLVHEPSSKSTGYLKSSTAGVDGQVSSRKKHERLDKVLGVDGACQVLERQVERCKSDMSVGVGDQTQVQATQRRVRKSTRKNKIVNASRVVCKSVGDIDNVVNFSHLDDLERQIDEFNRGLTKP